MKPKLSQVFLKNEQTLEKIAQIITASKKDVVFEIGAGKGQLTKHLIKNAKKVIACEIDKALMPYLKSLKAEVLHEDVLKASIPKEATIIAGNIPYHLSGKITEKALKEGKRCVLLYQKEFAQRLISLPGTKDYSRLTVLAKYLSIPKIRLIVSKNDFCPVPKVDSALVEFTPLKKKYDEKFFNFIKSIFKFKNKSVKNALICSRRDWSSELDKRKIKEKISKNSDKKVVSLSIPDLIIEYEAFNKQD
ncbi:MAG: 16S rRNA (adenine(1518)-N(6)/adenine(1519)-N(6))-dimethyltransferase RsmA [Candidatus Nanoarchaeia archaeon]|nr:16S rRNA (adenine(1518)-N(6)/adenine(1519)-N(6))-dimethyltransferase RsmA [Candidatus Nanoarchaeia archaeon]